MLFRNVCHMNKLIGVETGRLLEALLCAKAKRQQQQSAQAERKSTTRCSEEPIICNLNFIDTIVLEKQKNH